MKYPLTNDFKKIILENIPLIDVRAPIEYEKGSFLNSFNSPILNNEERHIIGICYKKKGNEEATKLGYKLVSGKVKEERINSWLNITKENPSAMLYCFRGGSRSRIAQEWLTDALGREIYRLEGGYKAFRNYLIDSLSIEKQNYIPLILTGLTGSGKTILLKKLRNSIDLEGLANHRGSAFGCHATPQPTQINFENNLAYAIIKMLEKNFNHVIFEDESKNIGRDFIPKDFFNFFHNGQMVFLETTLEERIKNTLREYVIDSQEEYIDKFGSDLGLDEWFNYIYSSIEKVRKKLGGDREKLLLNEFNLAFKKQLSTTSIDAHKKWIEIFLREYYDPLYNYSLEKNKEKIIFKGNSNEVLEYLISLK